MKPHSEFSVLYSLHMPIWLMLECSQDPSPPGSQVHISGVLAMTVVHTLIVVSGFEHDLCIKLFILCHLPSCHYCWKFMLLFKTNCFPAEYRSPYILMLLLLRAVCMYIGPYVLSSCVYAAHWRATEHNIMDSVYVFTALWLFCLVS